jgi:cytochrome c oxidase subunit 2
VNRKSVFVVLVALGAAAIACGSPAAAPDSAAPSEPEASGEDLFRSLGCSECHSSGSGIAPSLDGVYGSEVSLESGETVVADEAYLRESILSPQAETVRGYSPIMPNFAGRISDEELSALVEYLQSLAEP